MKDDTITSIISILVLIGILIFFFLGQGEQTKQQNDIKIIILGVIIGLIIGLALYSLCKGSAVAASYVLELFLIITIVIILANLGKIFKWSSGVSSIVTAIILIILVLVLQSMCNKKVRNIK